MNDMAKPTRFTQTFSYNGQTVHLSGTIESITHLRETLEVMKSYQKFLEEAVQLLQYFADSREGDYQIEEGIDGAAELLQKIEAIGKLTAPTLTFTTEEQYESIILDLCIGIKKQEDLLKYYKDEYAQTMSPYKEGEIYKTPQGAVFYISQVRASKERNIKYAVYGIRYSPKETLEKLSKKVPTRIRPNSKWQKIE